MTTYALFLRLQDGAVHKWTQGPDESRLQQEGYSLLAKPYLAIEGTDGWFAKTAPVHSFRVETLPAEAAPVPEPTPAPEAPSEEAEAKTED